MVIKTVATFASRPLRWFALLSLPLFVVSFAAFAHSVLAIAAGGDMSMPIAGSGIVFLASAVVLLCSGALAELTYSRGDIRDREFLKLTQTVRGSQPGAQISD